MDNPHLNTSHTFTNILFLRTNSNELHSLHKFLEKAIPTCCLNGFYESSASRVWFQIWSKDPAPHRAKTASIHRKTKQEAHLRNPKINHPIEVQTWQQHTQIFTLCLCPDTVGKANSTLRLMSIEEEPITEPLTCDGLSYSKCLRSP